MHFSFESDSDEIACMTLPEAPSNFIDLLCKVQSEMCIPVYVHIPIQWEIAFFAFSRLYSC